MARRPSQNRADSDAGGAAPWWMKDGFPPRWLLWVLAALTAGGVMAAVAGDQARAVFQTYIYAIFTAPLLAAAGMLGMLLTAPFARCHSFDDSPQPAGFRAVVAVALGLGVFALATLFAGALHLMEPGGNAWAPLALPVLGAVAGYAPTRTFFRSMNRAFFTGRANRGDWLFLLAAVPAAMLLLASTFPPGPLWRSEGGGYDVLEYHLQLPREYAQNNSTAPLHHNVYSYLPQNVEMLYLLQMQFAKTVMGNDRITGYVWSAFPAQFLHAALTLLTAAALALMPLGRRHAAGEQPFLLATGRAIAVLLFLGVPWTIVTGSLAFNEAGMLLFGTLALGIAWSTTGSPTVRGLLVGLLLGLAVGCKMTAGVFFALPVALIFLVRAAMDTRHVRHLAVAALAALAVFSPWAIRAAAYSGGNPVFPIAASMLPRNDWTMAQAQHFARGHAPREDQRSLAARLNALADCSLFDEQWSVQPYVLMHAADENPPAQETYAKYQRVGLLWVALPLALACAFIGKSGRGQSALLAGVLAVQVAAWLFATHLQSRFLLPAAIPLALLAGRGVQGFHFAAEGMLLSAVRIITGTLIGLHALAAVFVLLPEANLFGGTRDPNRQAPPIGDVLYGMRNVAAAVEDPTATRHLPPEKVLLLGDATAYCFVGPVEYFTVFDTNPPLALHDQPQELRRWLQEQNIRYVWVNWFELARLQDTYGLDLAVPPRAPDAKLPDRAAQIAALYGPQFVAAGLQDTRVPAPPGVTVYRTAP